jgi:hypothetical protein
MPTGKYTEPRKQRYADNRKKKKETRWAELRESDEFWDTFLEQLSQRGRVKAHLELWGIPWASYSRWMNENPEKKKRVQEALEGFAQQTADQMQDDIDAFDLSDPRFARIRLDTQQWLASRYNPGQFSERQRLDITTTDLTKLHLEELRLLSQQRRSTKVINPQHKLEQHYDSSQETNPDE